LPQLLNVFVRGAAGGLGDQSGVVEQSAFGCGELSLFEPSFSNSSDRIIGSSLNPQEVGVAVDSIRTTVKGRNIGSEHLFVTPGEVPFGEVNRVRELYNLPQEVGPRSKAFDDARDLLPSGSGTPVVVSGSGFAGGLVILDDRDLGGGFWIMIRHKAW
jgi:hypothetical protein